MLRRSEARVYGPKSHSGEPAHHVNVRRAAQQMHPTSAAPTEQARANRARPQSARKSADSAPVSVAAPATVNATSRESTIPARQSPNRPKNTPLLPPTPRSAHTLGPDQQRKDAEPRNDEGPNPEGGACRRSRCIWRSRLCVTSPDMSTETARFAPPLDACPRFAGWPGRLMTCAHPAAGHRAFGCGETMSIDRNARARMASRIQATRALTHAQRGIARAILMACDCRTGRTVATYDKIAELAGAARSTVGKAVERIERIFADVLEVVRRKENRRGRNGGTVRANAVNLYLWRLPAAPAPHKSEGRAESTNQTITMDPELSAVLVRLGNSVAAREARLTDLANAPNLPGGSGGLAK